MKERGIRFVAWSIKHVRLIWLHYQATINELARANEELENVSAQLYETGQTLDEAHAEVGGA